MPGHVDDRVVLAGERGQAGRVGAVHPDEADTVHRVSGRAPGGTGDIVAGGEGLPGDGPAEEHGAAEDEGSHPAMVPGPGGIR
ncbi:hypothetical protein GCM10022225_79000 [Plantactinospora mayteni]|uniref:Uncharacterized protein n=1 Tax=Plantactinospora mayteni TaxID=566021 RepID=A0ABQ4F2X3_9ACTN|nr:hypothetical protein Pma05_78220 [Plantactinospora mayteni]